MIISMLAGRFAPQIIFMDVMIREIKFSIWLMWGAKFFPHILVHTKIFRKDLFAVTFTNENEWQVYLAEHLGLPGNGKISGQP